MSRDPAAALRACGLRVTPQRRAILQAFRGCSEEHLSADEVHVRASAEAPELARGTVYATLAELSEHGLVAAFSSPDPVRYELNTEPHDHFRCRLCLRLFDVALGPPDAQAILGDGFVVEVTTVLAEGACEGCGDFGRGLRAGTTSTSRDRRLADAAITALSCVRHETALGPLLVAASRDGVVRVAFEGQADFEPLAARARGGRGSRPGRTRVGHAIDGLDAYLGGGREQADDRVDWAVCPVAGRAALEATRAIPYAGRRSYERVGAGLDVTPYDVGYAMGVNPMPLLLPCHRVTRGTGYPDDYVAGTDRRARLHELEAHGRLA